ncbi:MAG: hypothetical protein HY539_00060, partial [Deltaproteobacteria bacterium]|nr:hypothetical protein [Deltaproteobacteria bacterium]
MKKLTKTISLAAFLLIGLLARPLLACEEGFISLEDACSALYMGNRICLLDPQDGLNTNQDSICFRGKFMTYEDYKDVVDLIFAISYPSDINNVNDVVRVPAMGEIQTEDGSFALTVGLPGEGLTQGEFQAIVHADFISGSQIQRVSETRQLFRVGRPDMSILAARESGAASQSPYTVSQNDDRDDDGIPNSIDPDVDGDGILNADDPDDDNDGLLDVRVTESGTELDPIATRESRLEEEEISASKIDLCIATTPGLSPVEGNALLFSAVDEVTDDTNGVTKVTRTALQPTEVVSSDSDFCHGHIVTFPLGHGLNRLEVEVNNVTTEGTVGQRIALEPFRNDMRGPKLCVKYYRDQNLGSEIPGVDGRVLIADQRNSLSQVFVDVTSCEIDGGQEPLQEPLLVQAQHETDAAGQSVFDEMSKRVVNGRDHFVAAVSPLQFPINTYTIKAKDLNGNETIDSHSFSFGKVRPVVDSTGKFDPIRGMVPEAISAYLPADTIQGELKATLLKILNSAKFKQEMLPDLFIPTPLPSSVLRHFQDKMGCDSVFSEDYTRVFKLYDTTVREVDIPRLDLMDGNKARLTLEIKDLQSDVEFFVVNYIDSDDDGIMDIEDKDDDCHDTNTTRWIPANNCPSPDNDYENEDLDDVGDGHLDTVDFPGELRT